MSLKNNWEPTDTLRNNNVNDIADAVNSNTKHKDLVLNNEEYVHGLKYDESNKQLKLKTSSGDISIGGSGDSIGFNGDSTDLTSDNVQDAIKEVNDKINEHESIEAIDPDGVHGLRYDSSSQKLQYKSDQSWLDVPTGQRAENDLAVHKAKDITNPDGIHGLKYDISNKNLQYHNGMSWENIPTGEKAQEQITNHEVKLLTSEDGIHGLRYDNSEKKLYYWTGSEWEEIQRKGGDILVSGLTPETLRAGFTVIITDGYQETQRIVGTYTNDANAVANDIISGKTAYVKGKKITGNISKRTGNIWNGNPYVSGNYLYSNLSNGYYENAKIEMSKGNLSPENIRQGVNIFGVNGTLPLGGNVIAVAGICVERVYDNYDARGYIISFDSSIINYTNAVIYANNIYKVYFNKSVNIRISSYYYGSSSYAEYLNLNGSLTSGSFNVGRSDYIQFKHTYSALGIMIIEKV